MKIILSLICVMSVVITASGLEKTSDISKIEPQLIINNVSPFQAKIQAVFEILKQKKMLPENFADNTTAQDKIIEAILKSAGNNLGYAPANCKDGATIACEAAAQAKIHPAVMLRDGKICYLRLDSMNDADCTAALTAFSKLSSDTCGVILDIRHCKGFNVNNADTIIAKIINNNSAADNGKCPRAAVLTSANTTGSAEVIAWTAAKSTNILSMGEATAGNPFKPEVVKLSDNSSLLIPVIPPAQKHIPLSPVTPLMETPAGGSAVINATAEDQCVMKAADMLISLKTFNNKKK